MTGLADALAALYRRVPLGMRLGLDPMREACARADHPERAFRAVHIAGTNGKGSTCAMVESIARAAGRRTGLYTSPHLCRFAERIRIDGEPIDDDTLTRILETALDVGADLSFFETATLAAFLAFREAKVEIAVIEVGIGGRLDATNVFDAPPPLCCAITSVGFDHMDKLGDTLDVIAREKAAIAKAGVPLVLGALFDPARSAAIAIANEVGAPIVEAHEDRGGRALPDVRVALEGPHQRANAAVAWAIADQLGIGEDARLRGLAAVKWPGRLERIRIGDGPLGGNWILDGAHNIDGIHALIAATRAEDLGAIVFGALADKAWPAMLEALKAIDAPRVFVSPSGRAAVDARDLAMNDTSRAERDVGFSIAKGLERARELAGRRPVLVCGSLYLVGEVRALLLGLSRDPPVAL